MKVTYLQRGEALDYKNLTDKKIEAGTVITMGMRVGIAGTDILPGETGALHVTGVFEFEKIGSGAIEQGTEVYISSAGITTEASGNLLAGYAAAGAETGDTSVYVKINA